MSIFILGPYYLKTKGGYTTGQSFTPGFLGGVSNFSNGGSSGYVTTGQDITLANNVTESSTIPATITTSRLADSGAVSYLMGGPTGATRLRIYKGTRPAVSSMSNLSDYDSNLLIDFAIPAYADSGISGFKFLDISISSSIKMSSTQDNYMNGFSVIAGICGIGTSATASGTASWFWFGNYNSPTNLTDVAFVTGDVTNSSGSGDLLMVNTSITAGTKYTSAGFKLSIPAFYTV